MTLPPLPLRDGCLFVDNSMLELLTTCPRALQYNRFHKRIAAVSKPSLTFGSAIHLALEHRYKTYRNMSPDPMLHEEITTLLTKFFEDKPVEDGEYRNLNWALELMRMYNNKFEIEPFQLLEDKDGKVQVELPFALPLFTYKGELIFEDHPPTWLLPSITNFRLTDSGKAYEIRIPVIYTGRIDLPVLWDDTLTIIDHKTTSMLGTQFTDGMKMSAQQKGYAWAFQTLSGQHVSSYCINAIRVKEPGDFTANAYKKLGGRKNPPSHEQVMEKADQLKREWWNESLIRERFYIKPGELEEWKFNAIAIIKEMFYHYEQGYMPMKTAWCNKFGRCPYFDVCSLDANDRGVMLDSGLFMDNTWDPLHGETASLQ